MSDTTNAVTRISPSSDNASVTVTSPPPPGEGTSTETQAQQRPPTHLFSPDGLPTVPGYLVSREIARGGMGVVYAAHDPVFDREVAVKVMHLGQDAERFVIESKVTAQLPHPGVPPVYALGTLPDGRPFLAMKLIRGHTLAELLTKNEQKPAELLAIFEAICQTVGFAHNHRIIHRDLKPANVMIGAFAEVLVMDWGLAKSTSKSQETGESEDSAALPASKRAGSDETQAGQVKGTPAYMAPEQARGEPVDARTDVFALGAILAVILTGKPPFLGTTAMDTVLLAAKAELGECLTQLNACAADAELVAVAKRCLAASAADRYANGEEVAAAVSAYRAGVEERLRKAERDRAVSEAEAREQRKRRRIQMALGVSVLVTVCGAGGIAWWQDRQATERQYAAERAEAERLAAEERAKLEKAFRKNLTQQSIHAALALAADLRNQFKFKEADTALVQAEDIAQLEQDVNSRQAAIQARRELAFVVKLDDIRFRKWTWIAEEGGTGHFNTEGASREYQKAFAEWDLDLTTREKTNVANVIATSAVKTNLVAAVDDWALYERDEALRVRLLEIARSADPGPWTDRLRDPVVRASKAAIAKLADEADPATTSPAALCVLAELMGRHGLNPTRVLSAARTKRPTDFDLAFVLGRWHTLNSKDGQEIGPYEAALALRPNNVTVWLNLGVALHNRGDADGAILAWEKAVQLDPKDPIAHYDLGWGLYSRGKVKEAIAAYKEAIRLDPKYASAHYDLGVALRDLNDMAGAIAAWKQAIQYAPKAPKAYINLAVAYAIQQKYPEAIASARGAINADPKSANAHAILGLIYQQTGDLSAARVAITEAARLDPKKWGPTLARLPRDVAPPPREVKR